MRKSILSIVMLAMAGCMLAACGNKSANGNAETATTETAGDDSPAMQLLNSVPFTEEGLVSMVKTPEQGTITPEEYEAMYLAYSKVAIDENSLELENNFVDKAYTTAFRNRKLPENKQEILKKLMSNPSPQVRGQAIIAAADKMWGPNESQTANAISVLQNEKNPYVIKCGVGALANELKHPEVAKFVLAQVDNENPLVRRKVANAVGNSWSKGVSGVKEAALKLMGDKDEDTRKIILSGVGNLSDDSFVPELAKVLDDPEQAKLHGEVVRSLSKMWLDYPKHEHSSKAAFDATVKYLMKKPRTDKVPAWDAIAAFATVSNRNFPAFKESTPYLKSGELVKVLADIAADPNMNWLGRGPAAEAILVYGTRADLEKVRKTVAANAADKDAQKVLDVIDRELNK